MFSCDALKGDGVEEAIQHSRWFAPTSKQRRDIWSYCSGDQMASRQHEQMKPGP